MPTEGIRWPEKYAPEHARVHVSNELFIEDVDAEVLWAHLIRADARSDWYDNCSNLSFEEPGGGPDLEPGTEFRWWTVGLTVRTCVEEFEPPTRLALVRPSHRLEGLSRLTDRAARGRVSSPHRGDPERAHSDARRLVSPRADAGLASTLARGTRSTLRNGWHFDLCGDSWAPGAL